VTGCTLGGLNSSLDTESSVHPPNVGLDRESFTSATVAGFPVVGIQKVYPTLVRPNEPNPRRRRAGR
jgi:hypothetical protein